MSIRFPSDDNVGMSDPSPPRRRGGGGLFFLMILGVLAFVLIRGIGSSGPAAPEGSNPTDRSGITQYPDLQQPTQPTRRADQDDWGMEDGPVQRNASSKTPSSGSSNATSSNSDWGMEGVTSTKKQQPANRFSQPSSGNVITPKKPATQGDWGLDTDVDSGAKPAVPKKNTQGDWGLEQVE